VLKAVAEFEDVTVNELLERIVTLAFEGKCPFSDNTLKAVARLKGIYGLDGENSDSK
jgi:hypothetical protein